MTTTAAVVQIGKHGGRGFILLVGDRRYVITAAHCIFDKLVEKLTYPYPREIRTRSCIRT
jgi:hypothetical protein